MHPSPKPPSGDEFLPTRNSLLSRLKNWDDQEGWRDFFDTYWKFLYCIAVKAGLSDSDARDVVQETVVAVAKGLREGRFKAAEGRSFSRSATFVTHAYISDPLVRIADPSPIRVTVSTQKGASSVAEPVR